MEIPAVTVAEVTTRDALTAKVTPFARGLAGGLAALAAWTGYWLGLFTDDLTGLFTVEAVPLLFRIGWAILFVLGIGGMVTGWDVLCRTAFAVACFIFSGAVLAATTDRIPWQNQFYAAGLSGFAAVAMAALVANPLRRWPDPKVIAAADPGLQPIEH